MLPNLELKGTVQYHDNKGGFVSSNSRYTVEYSAMYSLYLSRCLCVTNLMKIPVLFVMYFLCDLFIIFAVLFFKKQGRVGFIWDQIRISTQVFDS